MYNYYKSQMEIFQNYYNYGNCAYVESMLENLWVFTT